MFVIFAVGFAVFLIIKQLLSEQQNIVINQKNILGILFLIGGLINLAIGFFDDKQWLLLQGTILLIISAYLLNKYLFIPYEISNEDISVEGLGNDNKYWDNNYYHKKSKVYYPYFKFDEDGWSVKEVYLPRLNVNTHIDYVTGDNFNKANQSYKWAHKSNKKTIISSFNQVNITKKYNKPALPLNLKESWENILPFFNDNGVQKFYHFTDRRNLQSIIDNGGLYSWKSLSDKSIKSYLVSNEMSHGLDVRHNLEYYIRLSFSNYHPMSTKVSKEKNIELIWLEIDTQIALSKDTLFSNINATDSNVQVFSDFDLLNTINYNLFKRKYYSLNFEEQKQYQAEIMIKDFLPISYIINIENLKARYL